MPDDMTRVNTSHDPRLSGRLPNPSFRTQLLVIAVILALGLLLLGFIALLGAVIDQPFRVFSKEVAEQYRARGYVGFLAHITWFLWVVAATAGLLAAAFLWRRDGRSATVHFFLAASLLTGLLLFDDFVMLHEWVPVEEMLYALYAAILLLLLIKYRTQFARGGILLAVLAGAFWATSIATDEVQELMGIHAHALEDGAKVLGTGLWAAFMVWSALRSMGWTSRSGAAPRSLAPPHDAEGTSA